MVWEGSAINPITIISVKDKAIISAVLINLPLPSPLFENSFNIIIAVSDSIIITDLHYTIRGFGIIDI